MNDPGLKSESGKRALHGAFYKHLTCHLIAGPLSCPIGTHVSRGAFLMDSRFDILENGLWR